MERLPLVSPLDRALFLRAQPYLDEVPAASIAAMAQYAEERAFAGDEIVHPAGQSIQCVYFLASGALRTEDARGGFFEFNAPAGIGLLDALAGSRVPPRIVSTEQTFALSLELSTFMQILEDDFEFFLSLAAGIGRGLREAGEGFVGRRPAEEGFSGEDQRATVARLDLVHRLARARQAPLFRGSNLTVLTELLRFRDPRLLQTGDVLYAEGGAVESMALVLDGGFGDGDSDETHYPAGSVVGSWEILSRRAWRETTRATAPSRVMEIDGRHFADVLEDHFEFATDYLGKMAGRLIALRFPDSAEGPESVN